MGSYTTNNMGGTVLVTCGTRTVIFTRDRYLRLTKKRDNESGRIVYTVSECERDPLRGERVSRTVSFPASALPGVLDGLAMLEIKED